MLKIFLMYLEDYREYSAQVFNEYETTARKDIHEGVVYDTENDMCAPVSFAMPGPVIEAAKKHAREQNFRKRLHSFRWRTFEVPAGVANEEVLEILNDVLNGSIIGFSNPDDYSDCYGHMLEGLGDAAFVSYGNTFMWIAVHAGPLISDPRGPWLLSHLVLTTLQYKNVNLHQTIYLDFYMWYLPFIAGYSNPEFLLGLKDLQDDFNYDKATLFYEQIKRCAIQLTRG
jgi:hypothetical protein